MTVASGNLRSGPWEPEIRRKARSGTLGHGRARTVVAPDQIIPLREACSTKLTLQTVVPEMPSEQGWRVKRRHTFSPADA
jgi:hypothetical protein